MWHSIHDTLRNRVQCAFLWLLLCIFGSLAKLVTYTIIISQHIAVPLSACAPRVLHHIVLHHLHILPS